MDSQVDDPDRIVDWEGSVACTKSSRPWFAGGPLKKQRFG